MTDYIGAAINAEQAHWAQASALIAIAQELRKLNENYVRANAPMYTLENVYEGPLDGLETVQYFQSGIHKTVDTKPYGRPE